jgi:hypothetical protein
VNGTAGLIIAVGGATAVVVTLLHQTRRAYKKGKREVGAFRDAVLGRDAIIHPDTGEELAPAVPGMGSRMATIEEAVVAMADERRRVDHLEERVTVLEKKDMERALARTESIELMRTIDAALKSQPEDNYEPRADKR